MTAISVFSKFEDVRLAVMALIRGEQNNAGSFTLRTSQTTTVVSHPNCAPGKTVNFSPTTLNAAGALATTYIQAANIVKGSFTVTHASAVSSDRTFMFEVVGGG